MSEEKFLSPPSYPLCHLLRNHVFINFFVTSPSTRLLKYFSVTSSPDHVVPTTFYLTSSYFEVATKTLPANFVLTSWSLILFLACLLLKTWLLKFCHLFSQRRGLRNFIVTSPNHVAAKNFPFFFLRNMLTNTFFASS